MHTIKKFGYSYLATLVIRPIWRRGDSTVAELRVAEVAHRAPKDVAAKLLRWRGKGVGHNGIWHPCDVPDVVSLIR